MGHLKDISNQPKIQTFPSSTFEIAGEVPASQCSEARIEDTVGLTQAGNNILIRVDAFIGFNLVGKTLTIIAPPANAGDYVIVFNNPSTLVFNPNTPAASDFNDWYVHDGGALILTRNTQSFFRFFQEFTDHQESTTGQIFAGQTRIFDAGKFLQDFTGFTVETLGLIGPDQGIFTILSNDADNIFLDHTFTNPAANISYSISIPHPYPATLKGGTLYTTAPTAITQQACSILFDPLT